jgi:hypothetical protein
MPDGIRWVGLDVHARESRLAVFDQAAGEVSTKRVVGRRTSCCSIFGRSSGRLGWSSEAGPTGYDWCAGRWRRGSSSGC